MLDYFYQLFGPNLYLVAIAVCGQEIDPDRCGPWTTYDFHKFWVYRPSLDACASYADAMLETLEFDPVTQVARVYCVRAETFQDAHQFIIP